MKRWIQRLSCARAAEPVLVEEFVVNVDWIRPDA